MMNTSILRGGEKRKTDFGGPSDKNIEFLRLLDKNYVQEIRNNTPILKENLKKIRAKLERLTTQEQQQWADTWYLKCKTLSDLDRQFQFAIAVKTLVSVSNEARVEYDRKLVEELLKWFYFQKYGHQIVDLFSKAGYKVSEFETLSYDDPWYSKLFDSVTSIF